MFSLNSFSVPSKILLVLKCEFCVYSNWCFTIVEFQPKNVQRSSSFLLKVVNNFGVNFETKPSNLSFWVLQTVSRLNLISHSCLFVITLNQRLGFPHQLHRFTLWSRWHSSFQNNAYAEGIETSSCHVPYARNEGKIRHHLEPLKLIPLRFLHWSRNPFPSLSNSFEFIFFETFV